MNVKQFFAAAILVLASFSVFAQNTEQVSRVKQPKKSWEERAKSLTDTLNAVLNLNSDQYQKAYASNLKYLNEKASIKKSGVDLQTAKPQIAAAAKTRKTEIAAILTSEQIIKWEAWKKSRKAQFMKEHPDMGKGQGQHPSNNTQEHPVTDEIDGM